MSQIVDKSAAELLAMLRRRQISSVELLGAFRSTIERHDDGINAVVHTDYESALRHAAAADEARARSIDPGELGPLHGLPMTVKEAFDVAGMPTTWGMESHKGNFAARNADAVDRLVSAGAIVFGKTNVPEGLADCQTFNPLHGLTTNPWKPEVTCGGSSGGSAAALAARFTPIELGSDLAGSIRTPAHFCGVFSHKPSYGLVSQVGHSPSPTLEQPDLAVAGPMARSAGDLALMLELLAGPAAHDAAGWRVSLPKPRFDRISDFRIAVLSNHTACDVDSGIVAAIEELASKLRRSGAQVDDKVEWPIDLERCFDDYMVMVRAVSLSHAPKHVLEALIREAAQLGNHDRSYRAAVRRAAALSHHAWSGIDRRRHDLRLAWQDFFRDYDIVMCPVHSSLAFPHDTTTAREDRTIRVNGRAQDYNNYLFWPGIAGLSYLPSTVRPIALVDGLPAGVQLIGPYLEDMTPIRFAALLEELVEWNSRPEPAYRE